MRKHVVTILLVAGLAMLGAPALAQLEGEGQTDANGCLVFTGTGSGQIISEWGVYPIIDVGTIHVTNQVNERKYTLVFEGQSFPSVPLATGVSQHRGFGSWRFVENGIKGTNRYSMVLTLDNPTSPTSIDIVLDGEVVKGNRYTSGGSHMVSKMDYATGAYTISHFSIVLCLP